MNTDPNEVVVAAIGVIGTLLGTILGWVLNSISQMGRLSFYVSRWEHEVKSNVRGVMLQCSTKDSAEKYHYELEFDVYNSSNETRIMRDVRLSFRSNKATLFEDKPHDGSSGSTDGRYSHYEVISPINIPPNSVLAVIVTASRDEHQESEVEDFIKSAVYVDSLARDYAIPFDTSDMGRGNLGILNGRDKKWSDKIRQICARCGCPCDDELLAEMKTKVSKLVAAHDGPLDEIVTEGARFLRRLATLLLDG